MTWPVADRLRPALAITAALILAGCAAGDPPVTPAEPTAALIAQALDTPTAAPSATPSPTATPTELPPTPSPTPPPTPYGCLEPPDDYARVEVNGYQISRRTLAMLEHAQALYGGEHDLVQAITQGSYHPGVEASFGTHDGGGAVDLAVRDLQDWHTILTDDLDAIILALRQAGFAAWVREEGDLYEDSPIHIHAIAVGDADLSDAAREQLAGPAGYFRGYDGLPVDPPQPDRHGGPIVCPWMLRLGYRDLRMPAG